MFYITRTVQIATCVHADWHIPLVSSAEFFPISMYYTYKYSEHARIIWPIVQETNSKHKWGEVARANFVVKREGSSIVTNKRRNSRERI